jgi:amino acid permease
MKSDDARGVVPEDEGEYGIPVVERQVGRAGDDEACSLESDAMLHIEKKASWTTVGVLQLSDVVGVGILAIGSGIALVGYVPAMFLFCFMLAINIYAGVLMQEVYLLCGQGAYDLPNMARLAVGRRWFTWLVTALYYSLLFSLIAQTLGVLGSTIKALLPNSPMCNWSFTLIAACLVIPLAQVRTLADSRAMQIVNTVTITLCVLISVWYMWARMADGTVPEAQGAERQGAYALNDQASVDGVIAALLRFSFSFSGNVIFPQMLHEMSKPQKFYKSFYISSPYQLVMYSIAGFTQFAYEGQLALTDSALIFQAIPTTDPLYGGCALLLAIHVALGYVTKATVAARALHGVVSPRTLNERSRTGQAWWLLCTLLVAFGSFLLSSAIPSFNALLGLLSAFQNAPLAFVVPAVLLVGARHKHASASARGRSLVMPALLFGFGIVLTALGMQQSTKGAKESFANGQPPFYC